LMKNVFKLKTNNFGYSSNDSTKVNLKILGFNSNGKVPVFYHIPLLSIK